MCYEKLNAVLRICMITVWCLVGFYWVYGEQSVNADSQLVPVNWWSESSYQIRIRNWINKNKSFTNIRRLLARWCDKKSLQTRQRKKNSERERNRRDAQRYNRKLNDNSHRLRFRESVKSESCVKWINWLKRSIDIDRFVSINSLKLCSIKWVHCDLWMISGE